MVHRPSSDVLTLAEAAAYLRLPEAEVVRSVQSQGLPGRCIGGEWRFLRSAIEHWLASASPTWEMRRAGILELAGKYQDDPDLESIVEEAHRRRGRPARRPARLAQDGDWFSEQVSRDVPA
jgi:excisionase family DNA binding protein